MQTYDGQDLYVAVFDKTAALFQSLVKNYPFVDGNKRVAALSAVSFIELNGHLITVSNAELIQMTLSTASGSLEVSEIAKWFEENSEPV